MKYFLYKEDKVLGATSANGTLQMAHDIALCLGVKDYNIGQTGFDDFTPQNLKYKLVNGKIILNPDFEAEQAQKEREARITEIKTKLIELDNKTIRPLRAGEQNKLDELEAQAEILRQEMKSLELEESSEIEEMGGLSLED